MQSFKVARANKTLKTQGCWARIKNSDRKGSVGFKVILRDVRPASIELV